MSDAPILRVDQVHKAFAAMQGDGTYHKILAKWKLGLDELEQ